MKSLTLNVEGLRCNACAEKVQNRLAAQPGVKNIQVSFEQAQARIFYDPQTIHQDCIIDAIQALGYRVPDQAAR